MTGAQLKSVLFRKRGDVSEFASYCGLGRQSIQSRFRARQVDIEILKKYAAWKGLKEADFITYALSNSEVKEYQTNITEPSTVAEPAAIYANNVNQESGNMFNIIETLSKNLQAQNEALLKFGTAAQMNAVTMAHLVGVPADKIDIVIGGQPVHELKKDAVA